MAMKKVLSLNKFGLRCKLMELLWSKLEIILKTTEKSYGILKYKESPRTISIEIKVPEEANKKEHAYWIFNDLAEESSNAKGKNRKKCILDLTLKLNVGSTSTISHEEQNLSLDLSL
ncbi:uncharacterized protein LOC110716721 [Chenopodium quinoa]|uniref:uncharacterized protein LOC110716721 n=1 Tax=Chenopodium quinoa TaxID=63459 RepID=UPI000B79A02B|nr:uncharacterized protein LOC110716721 [Chenopodium quinoa]